jgi:integrase
VSDRVRRLLAGFDQQRPQPTADEPVTVFWRGQVWRPALEAAGLQRDGELWLPGPYTLRHAFATWMLDAGIELFELARLMGTSVAMIDKTYGHLAKGHVERVRERMNARPTIATERESEAGDA